MKKLGWVPLPVLAAVYPIFTFYVSSSDQVTFLEARRALVTAAAIGLALYVCCRAVFRRADQAAIVASAFALVFFAHGRIAYFGASFFGQNAWGAVLLFETFALVLLITVVVRRTANLERVAGEATLIVTMLFAAYGLLLGVSEVRRMSGAKEREMPTGTATGRRPDIYYIILDAYGRSDTLAEYVAFDNRQFVEQLRQRGFVVPSRSRANYGQTLLSLASSLDFDFLDPASVSVAGPTDLAVVSSMVKQNRVIEYLQQRGYLIAAVPSGFQGTDPMRQAQVLWGRRTGALSEFERLVTSLTVASRVIPRVVGEDDYEAHRATVLDAFDTLRTSPTRADAHPRFVFVHILAPHPPFVFDEEGRLPQQDGPFSTLDGPPFLGRRKLYQQRYAAQVRFLNGRVLEAVDEILRANMPESQPIIILQGDHGPASHYDPKGVDAAYVRERMAILNAWYVPPDFDIALYDSISPVNTFRVVFNAVFNARLPLLPDRSLFSTYDRPYDFRETDESGRAVN